MAGVYLGEIYLAVSSSGVRARAAVALLVVTTDGKRKTVIEATPDEVTVPQAVAWGLLRALDRLGHRSAMLHTNLKAAFDLAGSGRPTPAALPGLTAEVPLPAPAGQTEEFAVLMARVAGRCAATGSAVAWMASAEEPMASVRRAAADALARGLPPATGPGLARTAPPAEALMSAGKGAA